MTEINNVEREFEWDDTLTKDAGEYILLPEGDYKFKVASFERARFEGSDKMPACPRAILKLEIEHEGKTAIIQHSLLLHSKTEWQLSAFFSSIGLKKKGEPLRMNWNAVVGSTGNCKVGKRKYNDEEYNEIKKFYPNNPLEKTYTPGSF